MQEQQSGPEAPLPPHVLLGDQPQPATSLRQPPANRSLIKPQPRPPRPNFDSRENEVAEWMLRGWLVAIVAAFLHFFVLPIIGGLAALGGGNLPPFFDWLAPLLWLIGLFSSGYALYRYRQTPGSPTLLGCVVVALVVNAVVVIWLLTVLF